MAKKLLVVGNYFEVNGDLVQIDLSKSNLPDRCKLAYAEMTTGIKHELVMDEQESDSA